MHEKTRYRSKIAILDNAHLKMQTLCYFMLKSNWPNGDEITSVWDKCNFFFCILFSSVYTCQFCWNLIFSNDERIPGFLMHCHRWQKVKGWNILSYIIVSTTGKHFHIQKRGGKSKMMFSVVSRYVFNPNCCVYWTVNQAFSCYLIILNFTLLWPSWFTGHGVSKI